MSSRVERYRDFQAGSWIGVEVEPPVMRTMSRGFERFAIAGPFCCTACREVLGTQFTNSASDVNAEGARPLRTSDPQCSVVATIRPTPD